MTKQGESLIKKKVLKVVKHVNKCTQRDGISYFYIGATHVEVASLFSFIFQLVLFLQLLKLH